MRAVLEISDTPVTLGRDDIRGIQFLYGRSNGLTISNRSGSSSATQQRRVAPQVLTVLPASQQLVPAFPRTTRVSVLLVPLFGRRQHLLTTRRISNINRSRSIAGLRRLQTGKLLQIVETGDKEA
ncbi:hypothetical protein EB796_002974 [Bugula neritina]|uniref:Uncharacterized protein n=1 Tax=Bugula neritina TaxID=10212 RepID=A0A7J7KLH6_BUGNE|nr:hypothetical protein EB796_002974 [Bugula neritina]